MIRNKKLRSYQLANKEQVKNFFKESFRTGNLEEMKYLLTSHHVKGGIHLLSVHNTSGYNAFHYACHAGYMDIIKYLLSDSLFATKCNLNEGLETATNHIEVVRYLLTSPELEKHADIHYKKDETLISAVMGNSIEVVEYLLFSTELTEHADPSKQKCASLGCACSDGYLEIVKLLLKTKKLTKEIQLASGLHLAFANQYLEVAKYIINNMNEDVKNNFDFSIALESTLHHPNSECADYLIFEVDIPYNKDTKNIIRKSNTSLPIEDLFKKREFNKKLNNALKNEPAITITKHKI